MDDRQHITILHASGETVEYTIEDGSSHTATVTSVFPTYPTPEDINLPGEFAICTLDGYESIHAKNTDDEIVSWEDDSVRDEKFTNWVSNNGGLVANDLVRPTNGMLSVTEGAQVPDRQLLFQAEKNNAYLQIAEQDAQYGAHENGMVTDIDPGITPGVALNLINCTDFIITLENYPANGQTHDVTVLHRNEVQGIQMFKNGPFCLSCKNILGLEGLQKQDKIEVSRITYVLPPSALTMALGVASHAEGSTTSAITTGAHAEGNTTSATGQYAHAEGMNGEANGIGSSSHNVQCASHGEYSSTYGYMTYASEQGEFACGAGNLPKSTYESIYKWVDRIFSVGDGICFMPNLTFTAGATAQCKQHDALAVSKMEAGYHSSGGTHALTINMTPDKINITAEQYGQPVTQSLESWLIYAQFYTPPIIVNPSNP